MADAQALTGLPIICAGVAIARDATLLLAGVDLTIARGACTLVLGANGAGKSTLLRLLHGLLVPNVGTIAWGGAPQRPPGQAMVFQRAVLLRRSAAANLRHALKLSGVRSRSAQLRIDHALAGVGLAELADRPARVLSGGEQQRLALARAWSLAPDVLFLDEPTASLDPPSARAVETIVNDIHAQGTTIVMTTHHLAQAKRLADRVILLHGGRIAEHTAARVFFHEPRSAYGRAFLEGERW